MSLQTHLVELVTARGSEVLDDPGEFRAALDDYLTDDDVSPGDRNVLTDAVRLGAVRRLLALLEHGSDPHAAVKEAGTELARERGSDDAWRSLRATALLGHAAGWLDARVVQSFDTRQPAAPSTPEPNTAIEMSTHRHTPPASVPMEVHGFAMDPASDGATAAAPRQRRRLLLWLGVGAVVLAAVGASLWWWLDLRGGSPEDTVEALFEADSCEEEADVTTGEAAAFVLDKIDNDDGYCAGYADYRSSYEIADLSENGNRATVEVDGTQRYLGDDESLAPERDYTAVLHLRRIDGEWLISNIEWTFVDE